MVISYPKTIWSWPALANVRNNTKQGAICTKCSNTGLLEVVSYPKIIWHGQTHSTNNRNVSQRTMHHLILYRFTPP